MSARRPAAADDAAFDPRGVLGGGQIRLYRNYDDGGLFREQDDVVLERAWALPQEIPAAWKVLARREAKLAAARKFAWHPEFGYLARNPAHAGTGIHIRAEFHLEGLHIIGDLPPVLAGLDAVRVGADSLCLDGIQQPGHIFVLQNRATVGLGELALCRRVQKVFEAVAQQEISARFALVTDYTRMFTDAVERALALLRAARLLSPGELIDLLSPVRLAHLMGFVRGVGADQIGKLLAEQFARAARTPPESDEEERARERRDARLADRINSLFARVSFDARSLENPA